MKKYWPVSLGNVGLFGKYYLHKTGTSEKSHYVCVVFPVCRQKKKYKKKEFILPVQVLDHLRYKLSLALNVFHSLHWQSLLFWNWYNRRPRDLFMLPGNVAITFRLQRHTNLHTEWMNSLTNHEQTLVLLLLSQVSYHMMESFMFLNLSQPKQMWFLSFEWPAGFTCLFWFSKRQQTLTSRTVSWSISKLQMNKLLLLFIYSEAQSQMYAY